MKARVVESYREEAENYGNWVGGGAQGSLRAYQAFHPNAAIYTVTYRGRTVWMTSKQQHIWHEVQKYWRRGQRDTLARIAKITGTSKATVSRFLRRLDLWRFLDLATIRGKGGGTYIFTRKDLQEKARRWTMKARMRARILLAARVKREAYEALHGYLVERRVWLKFNPVKVGSTGATFSALTGSQLSLMGDKM